MTAATVAVAISASWAAAQQSPSFVVVVNPANSVEMITRKEISDLFLKKKRQWQDGTACEPVDLESTSAVRQAFTVEVHEREVESVRSYWRQKIFAGSDTPPVELAGDAAVIGYVRTHPGAIGYVSPAARLEGVRVVQLITAPVVIRTTPPDYPDRAQRFGIEGTVELRITISAKGRVTDVEVLSGLSHGLTEAAVESVKKWRFEPATSRGVPISSAMNVTVRFGG